MNWHIKAKRREAALHAHWTQKKGKLVPKVQFPTIEEAIEFMEKKSIDKDTYHPYICPDCGAWHIGHYKGTKHKTKCK